MRKTPVQGADTPAGAWGRPGDPRPRLESPLMAEPYGNRIDPSERQVRDRYGERLAVRSVSIPDPGEDFLDQVPEPTVVTWVQQAAGLAGWGEAARVTLPAGADRFTAAEKGLPGGPGTRAHATGG